MSIRTPALIVLAGLALAAPAAADTTIVGGNIVNQTWTTAGSPYIVQGDITIPNGAFLEIQQGVTVQFASGDSQMAGDTSHVEVNVRGALRVLGTTGSPVNLTGQVASSGSWYGITADTTATEVRLDNVTINYARYGFVLATSGATFASTGLTVQNAQSFGVWIQAGNPTFDAYTAINNSYGIYGGDGSASFTNCIVRGGASASYGVYVRPATATTTVSLDHCTINAAGSYGVYVNATTGSATTVNVTSSIVTNHSTYGLYRVTGSGSNTVNVTYSDIWNNSSANLQNVSAGTGVSFINPLYVSTTNLRLTSNSPARFGASGNTDMGALPYVSDATPGLYGTLWTSTNLTVAGSPYTVGGDLYVPPGTTLTVQPGVTLNVSSGDIMQAGVTQAEIQIGGTLVADGTPASPITFTGSVASSGSWNGIELYPTASGSTFDNVLVRYARYGINIRATGSNTYSNLTVQDAQSFGVWIQAGSPTFDAFTAINNSYGIYAGDGNATFTSCVVRGGASASYGVYVRPTTATTSVALTNCTINAAGSYGVYVNATTGSATTVDVVSTIVTNHSTYGIYRVTGSGSNTVNVTYSDIWNNSSANLQNVSGGTGTVFINPLYVSTTNLRLTSNSPVRFGASGGGDMGALPYVSDATPGLYGTLWSNTNLAVAGSPYTVGGDLYVPPGITLTVQPGVTLNVSSGDIMQAGVTQAEIQIGGTLVADGTPASPITFTGSVASSGSWNGIELYPTASGSTFDNVLVRYARYGINIRANGSNTYSNLTVQDAQSFGVWIQAGSPTFDAFTAINNSYGIYAGDGNATFNNCVVRGGASASYGVYVRPTTATTNVALTNCTVNAAGSYGVYANATTGSATTVTAVNAIVTNHSTYGFYRVTGSGSNTVNVTYSDVWNNSSANYQNVSAGTGTISQNPLFVSTTDLRLQGTSVAIDAGTTGPLVDALGVVRPQNGNGIGGTEWDMGAYEYVLTAMCGNGAVEPGETCDSGAANGTYGACNASCSGLGPRCGDSATNGPEQCDDGNMSNTDACLNTCRNATCGDSYVRAGTEQCDDGNLINTDACVGACVNASCGDGYVRMGVEQCDDGNTNNADACSNACMASTCGDGIVQTGEECDDNNSTNTDACLNSCLAARCGDGFVRAGLEVCDDGNTIATDACTATCQPAVCGDGITRTGVEECDDANMVDTDACVGVCVAARCGDGFVRAGVEGCDDGNMVNGDACTNACVSSTCGDGVVQAGVETCDDANSVDTDACRNNCSVAMCGDSVVQMGVEDCDDGNTSAGDGCSPACEIETGPDAGGGGPDAGNPGDGDGGGGCCSTNRGGATSATLGVLLALILRRRRTCPRPQT